jgi:hypothetical protein
MQEGPPRGAFLPSAVTHFYSGQPMHFYSGVDSWSCAPSSSASAEKSRARGIDHPPLRMLYGGHVPVAQPDRAAVS